MQLLPASVQHKEFQVFSCTKNQRKNKIRGHKLSLTCACLDSHNRFIYSASKDGSVIKWCLQSLKILFKIKSLSKKEYKSDKQNREKHHLRYINCIAISSDDKFLATGGWDKKIRIWSAETLEWVHTFSLHKNEVTALAFRRGYHTLYSGSADRSVMIWTLEDDDNRCYVESLYGHESPITSMDASRKERVLTAGGRDQSLRIWKIVEQAQTVFQSKHESADVVRYVDDKTFISGGEDGTLSVWSTMKRTQVFSLTNAHKLSKETTNTDRNGIEQRKLNNWIVALATYPLREVSQTQVRKRRRLDEELVKSTHMDEDDEEVSSDDSDEGQASPDGEKALALVASGSCDSQLKVWKLFKLGSVYSLKLHQSIECYGFINDLNFTSDGKKLVAACGQEHKFGRWWKLRGIKNIVRVFDVDKLS